MYSYVFHQSIRYGSYLDKELYSLHYHFIPPWLLTSHVEGLWGSKYATDRPNSSCDIWEFASNYSVIQLLIHVIISAASWNSYVCWC